MCIYLIYMHLFKSIKRDFRIRNLENRKCDFDNYYNNIMGNQNQRQQNKQKNQNPNPKINVMKCPRCQKIFPQQQNIQQFANHIRNCFQEGNIGNNGNNNQNPNPINVPNNQQMFQYEKVPKDYTITTFKWEKKPVKHLNHQILGKNESEIKKLSFQEKEYWFRNKIQKLRIGWQNGADFMRLEKSNILMSSLIESQKVNMHKEVKIEFLGDKVNDAGGLLREWIHMVIKQIFDESTGIFTIANTEDIMYKLKWDSDLDEQFSGELFRLFGLIIGKSIFERTPLMCYLDRTILRQICESSVKIEDIYGYDKDLYKTWNFILDNEEVEDLETYFVIQKDTGNTVEEIELMEDGRNIKVTNENKFLFVDICIQMMTMDLVKKSVSFIKEGISKVIPNKLLSVFEPYEMEMILYGVPFIDVKEWKQNTIYKAPYSGSHNVIKWFWQVMQEFDQEQLANMLHFCTGSSRTPIHGFKKLESNRGNYSKFLIESSKFLKENPYPKGHTCFNRLQLPLYQNYEALKLYVVAISKNNLDGVFGLD